MIYCLWGIVAAMLMWGVAFIYGVILLVDYHMNDGSCTVWGYIIPTVIVWWILTLCLMEYGRLTS